MSYEIYVKEPGERVGRLEYVSPTYNQDGEEIYIPGRYENSIRAIEEYQWDLYFKSGDPNDRPEQPEQ